MLRALYDWSLRQARGKFAEPSLASVSFIESSFFPIPPDVLLIPMVIANRAKWIRYAFICTLASVLGALLGYYIGAALYEAVAQPILELYHKADSFDKVSQWYNTYGAWGVLFAAVTPFPYKVLTIFSGATGFSLPIFIAVSVVGRGMRFFLIAWLLKKFGEPIQLFVEKRLGLLFTLFLICLIGGFAALKFVF